MVSWLWLMALGVLALGVVVLQRMFARREQERKDQTIEELRELFEGVQKSLAQLEQEHTRVQRLYETHRDKNASFETQTNQVWSLYQQAGLQAGNAQAMLFGELQRAVMHLNRYREKNGEKPIQMASGLKEMVAEFKQTHGSHPEQLPEEMPHGG